MATISETKNKMIVVPKLRFGSFNAVWEKKALEDVFSRILDKNKEDNKNVLTISAQRGLIKQDTFFNKVVSSENVSGYYLLTKGDFAYNKSYSNGYPFGAIKRLTRFEKGIVSPLYICFRLKNSENSSEYFEQFFNSGKINREINKIAQEGARNHGLLNLSVSEFFSDIKFYVPTLSEQKHIASFLTSVDEWLEKNRKEKDLLCRYKAGTVQNIFSQKVRFRDGNGKLFPDWKEVKLKDVLKEHKTRNTENTHSEVFSVAKTKGVINQIEHLGRSFSAESLTNYKVIFPGDVIYTKSPTADFPFGIIKQNQTERTGVVSTLYAVFTPKNAYLGKMLHEYFISWINTYNYLIPLVQKGAKNTINIGNSDFLNGAKISLPISEIEQKMIVDYLISIDKLIDAKTQEVDLIVKWRKGLLQKLFI